MAFTGRAIYDTLNGQAVFDGVAEDVSEMISIISPSETPLLDRIGDAQRPATSVLHEWLEDALNPSTLIFTVALATTSLATALITDSSGKAMANHLRVGMQIKVNTSGEYIQITAIEKSTNIIKFDRGAFATTATTYAAGAELLLVSDVALEGSDVGEETGRARVRKSNYCQIFKKDVIVSGTVEAVSHLGVGSEFEYQTEKRLREILRDLEKSVVHGLLSGNSLGSSTAYRSMKGLWSFLATNIQTTGANSVTPQFLNDVVKEAWLEGTVPDLIVADANWRNKIDGFNNSRVTVTNGDSRFTNRITMFESSYGNHEVITSRWMPSNSLMVINTQQIKLLPLQGRSFHMQEIARTGDNRKRSIVGEYTLEVRNEEGMCKAYAV